MPAMFQIQKTGLPTKIGQGRGVLLLHLGGYRAITLSDPEESVIFWRIESEEEDEIMQPLNSRL